MHICLPPLPPTCQDSNFICITRPYIPSTAHFNARQLISYKGMKHQPHSLVAYLLSGIKMGSAGKGQFTTTYKILYYKISYLLTHTDQAYFIGGEIFSNSDEFKDFKYTWRPVTEE